MNTIGSTLNSINSSLISEINSILSTKSSAGTGTSSTGSSQAPDGLDLSQVGKLFMELQQLQSTDPAKLKDVLTEAAAKLKEAAGKTIDSTQAEFLNDLASRFQKAADTGSLSALMLPAPPDGGYPPSGPSSSGNSPNDLLATLFQDQGSTSTSGNSLWQSILNSISSNQSGSTAAG